MEFIISNSCFPADAIFEMKEFPPEFGIEIQIEFGTQYFWETALNKVMNGRSGILAIHAPFTNIDLSDKDLDEKAVFDYYQWSFDMYRQLGASQMVLHPDGKISAPVTEQERYEMRQRAMERISKLANMAKSNDVALFVENLRPKGYGLVFEQEEYIDLFRQIPDVDSLIDTGHLFLSGWDFEAVLSSLGGRIKSYHIDDTRGILDEHLPVGKGAINWKRFFSLCTMYTPKADMVLEYKNTTVKEIMENAELICQYLR